jgi:hypothetical protein
MMNIDIFLRKLTVQIAAVECVPRIFCLTYFIGHQNNARSVALAEPVEVGTIGSQGRER